eukprot:COSAG02_NODE_60657_length_270_cov_1.520468_1_plen_33_part_10
MGKTTPNLQAQEHKGSAVKLVVTETDSQKHIAK